MLPVNQVHPNTFGMRETIDKEKIHELGKSIDEEGQLQSILVRPDPNKSGYEIIAGERRWLAHKDAGILEIASVVRDVPDDLEAMELSLAENLHRSDLTPAETEQFLGKLWDTSNPETLRKDGKKLGKQARYQLMSELARRVGMPELQVSRILHARKERSQLPDNLMKETTYRELEVTRSLEDTPEIRNQILEMKLKNEDLVNLVKILKTTKEQSPEVAQQAVALVKAGRWDASNPESITKDGTKLGKQARYQSMSALARRVGMNERTVHDILTARKDILENPDVIKAETPYNEVLVTRTLEPELRKQVLNLNLGQTDLQQFVKTLKTVKEQSPELAQQAVALVQAGRTVQDVQRVTTMIAGTAPEVTRYVIQMSQDGQPVGEIEKFGSGTGSGRDRVQETLDRLQTPLQVELAGHAQHVPDPAGRVRISVIV